MQYFLKIFIVLGVIVGTTELAKKSTTAAAVLASLPITSLLAIIWLKAENTDHQIIANLSKEIFWMVLPSLVFFLIFPYLLAKQTDFWIAFGAGAVLTCGTYLSILKFLH